jgi:hypothetical protein
VQQSDLTPHARKIYTQPSRTAAFQGARRIAQWIHAERQTLRTFRARDIRRRQWADLTEPSAVNGALDYLENVTNWVQSREVPTTQRGGRPTIVYDVNPLVREMVP